MHFQINRAIFLCLIWFFSIFLVTSKVKAVVNMGPLTIGWSNMCWVNDRAYWTVRVDNTSTQSYTAPDLNLGFYSCNAVITTGCTKLPYEIYGDVWSYKEQTFGPKGRADASKYYRGNLRYLCSPFDPESLPGGACDRTGRSTFPNYMGRYGFNLRSDQYMDTPYYPDYLGTSAPILYHCPCSVIAPSNVRAVASLEGINITWQDNSDETAYQVERQSAGGSDWKLIASLSANSRNYLDTTAQISQSYTYRISATTKQLNWKSCSALSSPVSR